MSKKQYKQYFRPAYKNLFPTIKESEKGNTYAFCTACVCDVSIVHGGKSDISKHIKTEKHIENAAKTDSAANGNIENLFKANQGFEVTRAECLFTRFLLEHNIALSAADHAGPLFKKMFPDSDIAKQYSSARTKTTSIVNKMAEDHQKKLIEILKKSAFSLAVDGSNDTDTKLYPIVVTYFDENVNHIKSCLLSLPDLIGDSTGQNIADLIVKEFQNFEIPLSNLIAFGADNAAVMMGSIKGAATFLKNQQKELIIIGCPCHLLNLAAEKAAAALPINVDKVLVDIYYYLQKSSKRKQNLRVFQDLEGTEMNKILKHVCTRWLSLSRALERLIEQWDALLSFFHQEIKNVENKKRQDPQIKKRKLNGDAPPSQTKYDVVSVEEKIFYFLSTPLNKAFCNFLLYSNVHFDHFNTMLQSASPHVHTLKTILRDFLKGLLVKFVKPSEIKSFDDVMHVPYEELQYQKDDSDLIVGTKAYELVQELDTSEKEQFFSAVRSYFSAACAYVKKKFPMENENLHHAEIANVQNIDHSSFSSIRYFVEKFPFLLKIDDDEDDDMAWNILQKQFTELQCERLPNSERIDACVGILGKMRCIDGSLKYDRISKVLKAILTIPHSNAECERIFSSVKKNMTQFRSSMSTKTLQNILLAKAFTDDKCYEVQFSNNFLKEAKKSTMNMLTK